VASRTNREAIDSVWVGHRGTPIGKVAAVVRSRSGERRLRFRTSRELEIHDGLQIDVPGLPRPYGFAVDWFRIAAPPPGGSAGAGGKTAPDRYRAPAGSLLEVALPPDHPELPRGAAIYCSSSQAIKRRYRFDRPKPGQFRVRPPVAIRVELSPDRLRLQAAAPRPGAQAVETTLAVNGNFPATDNPAGMEQTFRDVFAKLGATPFAAGPLVVSNPGARFVPLSQLNPLRRRLLDDLARRWQAAKGEQLAPIKQAVSIPAISGRARACSSPTSGEAMTRGAADVQSSGEISSGIEPGFFRWSLKTDQLAALELFEPADWAGIDEVIVGICAESGDDLPDRLLRLAEQVGRARVRLALPMIMRSWESGALCALAGKLVQTGWLKWQIANMSGLAWLRNLPAPQGGAIHIAADWPIYVTNLAAARQVLAMEAEYLTLSPEDGLENIRDLLAELGNRAVVIAYQDTPLFISEACAGAAVPDGCAGRKDRCVATLDLKSSFGDRVLALNRRCRTVVINKRPFCLASRFKELAGAGASRLRADFLFRSYPPEQVREIWRRLRTGEPIPGTQLANIDRGLE
jgi:putative protease